MTLYDAMETERELEAVSRIEPRGRNPFLFVVSVPEAATSKGVAQSAVVRAINEGRLAAWTVGRMHFMRREDVQEWQPVRGRGRRRPAEPGK